MFPIGDDHSTLRQPVMTYAIIATIVGAWFIVQGGGLPGSEATLMASVCNLGMVPGELTRQAAVGTGIPLGDGMACIIDREPINVFTPITSMFLHGGWGHLLGNLLFLWVFGNNIEDSMGRVRFLVFYLLCGLVAALAHVLVQPGSPVPTVGASGAISGILGAYLVLYPRIHVRMLFIFIIFFKVFRIPAWAVLVWWFVLQVLMGLPELTSKGADVSGGVAVWAHVGGFVAGLIFVKVFENRNLVARRAVPA